MSYTLHPVEVKRLPITETKWSNNWLEWAAEPLTPYLVVALQKMIDEGKIKQTEDGRTAPHI